MTSFFTNFIHLIEIIHVQLPNEGSQIAVPKEVREDFFLKFPWRSDLNLCPFVGPGDEIGIFGFLHLGRSYLQNRVKFDDKVSNFFSVVLNGRLSLFGLGHRIMLRNHIISKNFKNT